MSHQIPKELKGEERIVSIPSLNIHLSKKASLYCLIATVISGLTLSINFYVFFLLFIVLNCIAYPIATFTISSKKFEGGNVPLDIFLYRKFKYKFLMKRIYIRRRDN